MNDYKSNLECPDLRPRFPHMRWLPSARAYGHEVGSDVDFDPNCESLTMDEAAILYHCALLLPEDWLVIGARLGWCSVHIKEAAVEMVVAVDPELAIEAFQQRFDDNTSGHGIIFSIPVTSNEYFEWLERTDLFSGFLIDGNHDAPCPLNDAMNCAKHATETAVVVFHDLAGRPIQEAVEWLMDQGWNARAYFTPNMMAVCWRGDFTPPDHSADPSVDWGSMKARMKPFPFERCK